MVKMPPVNIDLFLVVLGRAVHEPIAGRYIGPVTATDESHQYGVDILVTSPKRLEAESV
jgi:hypothetical protein